MDITCVPDRAVVRTSFSVAVLSVSCSGTEAWPAVCPVTCITTVTTVTVTAVEVKRFVPVVSGEVSGVIDMVIVSRTLGVTVRVRNIWREFVLSVASLLCEHQASRDPQPRLRPLIGHLSTVSLLIGSQDAMGNGC